MGSRGYKKLTIYLDEHVSGRVARAFREFNFKVQHVSKSQYKAKDEREYINKLGRQGGVFVTGDREFVNEILSSNFKCEAAVVYLPQDWDPDVQDNFVAVVSGFLQREADTSPLAVRGTVVYYEEIGLMAFKKGKTKLDLSWDRLLMEMDIDPDE